MFPNIFLSSYCGKLTSPLIYMNVFLSGWHATWNVSYAHCVFDLFKHTYFDTICIICYSKTRLGCKDKPFYKVGVENLDPDHEAF